MKAFPLIAAALMCSAASLLAVDTAPPQVTSISIAPASVDITSAPQTITATIAITDDESGFDFGNLNIYNQAGKQVTGAIFAAAERISGTALSGTYEVDVILPRYAAPGNWRAEVLMLDVADNQSVFGPQESQLPYPEPEDSEFTVVNTGTVDSTPVVISSVALTPGTVSTDGAAAEVTITVSLSDNLTGFSAAYIHLLGPDNGANSDIFGGFTSAERVSGDALSGTYVIPMTLPAYSESGTWTISVEAVDVAGNRVTSSDTEFEVQGGTPPPPEPSVPSFLAQALDAMQLEWTTSGSGWVHHTNFNSDGLDSAVTRAVPDDGEAVLQTTVTGPGTLYFDWKVDSEESVDVLSVEVVGGDSAEISGIVDWTAVSLDIPPGEQTVVWRYAKDGSDASGEDKGWVDRVHFIPAGPDTAAPKLQGLHLSTRNANITENQAFINFSLKVSDDVNGFSDGTIRIFDSAGLEQDSRPISGTDRERGDEWSGVYVVGFPIDTDWPIGKGRVEIELVDAVSGATRIYSPTGEDFPIPGSEIFHVTDGSTGDTLPPQLRALEVNPRVIDVSDGPATVTVTLRVTDEGRGFADGNLWLLTPDDGFVDYAPLYDSGEQDYDGIHQVELQIPRFAKPGTWSLSCYIRDLLSNDREYPFDAEFNTDSDPSITVVNTGTIDSAGPVVTAASISPGQIDTTAAAVPVEATVTITEDIAGLQDAYLFFYNPNDVYQPNLYAQLDGTNRISGDGMNGTYRVTRTIPQGSIEGTWRVEMYMRDQAGNFRNYGKFSATLPGGGTFVVGDGSPPSLFEAFLTTHSLTGNDSLPGADPDGDGINNVTELLLGTDPTDAAESGAGLLVLSRDATHLHYDLTHAAGLTATVNGVFLELRDAGGGAPLRLTGQTQNGLSGAWNNQLPTLQSGRTWRISLPFASGPTGFMRLHFEGS
jgi:hypothetical protein